MHVYDLVDVVVIRRDNAYWTSVELLALRLVEGYAWVIAETAGIVQLLVT